MTLIPAIIERMLDHPELDLAEIDPAPPEGMFNSRMAGHA
jgi:hypothetical protein